MGCRTNYADHLGGFGLRESIRRSRAQGVCRRPQHVRLSPALQTAWAQIEHDAGLLLRQSLGLGFGHEVQDHFTGFRGEGLAWRRAKDSARSFFSSRVKATLSSARALVFSAS